jgi:hypothetical protein
MSGIGSGIFFNILRDSAVEQGDFVNGYKPGTADKGNFTQVYDEITRRVLVNLLCFGYYLQEIGCVKTACQAHNSNRLFGLLYRDTDFHDLFLIALF